MPRNNCCRRRSPWQRCGGVDLRPLAFWDCRLESRRRHGRLSVTSVVFCQVEVSATSWSLVQGSPTDCGASLCLICIPQEWGGYGPRWAAAPQEKQLLEAWKKCANFFWSDGSPWVNFIDTADFYENVSTYSSFRENSKKAHTLH